MTPVTMVSLTVYSRYQSQWKAWEATLRSSETTTKLFVTTDFLYQLVPSGRPR